MAASVRYVGRRHGTRVLADVKETVVRDSVVLSVFGWLVMVL
jgi:hypothetical protein